MLASVPREKASMPKAQPVQKTATGMSALSIWMKLTDRYKYAALPSHSVPEQAGQLLGCNLDHALAHPYQHWRLDVALLVITGRG